LSVIAKRITVDDREPFLHHGSSARIGQRDGVQVPLARYVPHCRDDRGPAAANSDSGDLVGLGEVLEEPPGDEVMLSWPAWAEWARRRQVSSSF
jgi:hypothetical protein